ncbi:hypothetical protein MICABA_02833 [Microbacterium sp. T2.11-28]|nr:hypothetical protein MICABA_02833 [Microbacterium sp. T2.11-28]
MRVWSAPAVHAGEAMMQPSSDHQAKSLHIVRRYLSEGKPIPRQARVDASAC